MGKKEKRLQPSDGPDLGDSYTFLGIDANRKAIVTFVVGKRDYAHTAAFCRDLRARILGRSADRQRRVLSLRRPS